VGKQKRKQPGAIGDRQGAIKQRTQIKKRDSGTPKSGGTPKSERLKKMWGTRQWARPAGKPRGGKGGGERLKECLNKGRPSRSAKKNEKSGQRF